MSRKNTGVKRIEGYLKELKTSRMMHHCILFDTETYVIEYDEKMYLFPFRLGYAIYLKFDNEYNIIERDTLLFDDKEGFIAFIESKLDKSHVLYMFAHNSGFDVRVLELTETFSQMGYSHDLPIINGRTFIWEVRNDKGKITFLDTANFAVHSVGQLGKDLNFPKMDIDINTKDRDLLIEYCIRDVEILERFIIAYLTFIHQNELGRFCYTLASQSLTAYRTKFMTDKPHIHTDENTLRLERAAYHGGRVEAFYIGSIEGETTYYLDVNSMYPSVMLDGEFPTKLLSYHEGEPYAKFSSILKNYYVIADVELETDIPVYPVRTPTKLVFPIGSFSTVLHHKELIYAHEHNHIKKINRIAIYKKAVLFHDYVSFFTSKRREYKEAGNHSWSFITKIFGNSLYGKMGQLQPHREEIGYCASDKVSRIPVHDRTSGDRYFLTMWYGKVYKEYRQGETLFSIPSIAGAITANARMLLWNFIERAGFENLRYCDTDSLMLNEQGYFNLASEIDNLELGKLKLEGQSDRVKIYGAKDYVFGETVKKKGVPSKATILSEHAFEYLAFEGFITWLNEGHKEVPKAKDVIKKRTGKYDKGVVHESGLVTPLHYPLKPQD